MSLRVRLVAAIGYVLLLVLIATVLPLALNLSHRAQAEAEAQAESQARVIAALVAGQLGNQPVLRGVVREAARDLGARVIVVDARGALVADSAGNGQLGQVYGTRPEFVATRRGEVDQRRRHSDTLGTDLLVTAVPVFENGAPAGAVRVTQSLDAIKRSGRRDALALVGFGAVALALGLAAAWLLAGSLARPLHALAATARRVAAGDLSSRAPVAGSSEQQGLARTFNEMTERLGAVLEAQREFVANASHQLRTPLTGLRLRLEAATLAADDPAVVRELEAAETETERLSRMLNGLLALARAGADPGPGTRVDLVEIGHEAAGRWREASRRAGHELAVGGESSVPVTSSREDLAMALDNLIENALKYATDGGHVSIECATNGAWARISVADEGPGIPAADRERVFERFYRGASGAGHPGTGLGLAIVDSVARRWGGRARLEEQVPHGTRAVVELPRAEPEPGEGFARG